MLNTFRVLENVSGVSASAPCKVLNLFASQLIVRFYCAWKYPERMPTSAATLVLVIVENINLFVMTTCFNF